jgi:hypothetical protein
MSPPDLNLLTQAYQQHQWPILAGLIILTLIYVSKLPVLGSQWDRIPIKYRPLVVLGLGIVSGVAQALATKQPWLPALIENMIASMGAITTDQVQSKLRTKEGSQ